MKIHYHYIDRNIIILLTVDVNTIVKIPNRHDYINIVDVNLDNINCDIGQEM